ncbi:TM2 domain-containing protein DDB_G0287015 [Geodia barretti]|uniref:TM2 domain-containing protein DDB_G0287015 n=1 Tax=Geodia barretti TaxID=519541 RepID=A0AA35TB44_GEOBA|nr:TM2 domain-containing protein DDB_G0287015 [Geodia barretti]
MEKENRKALEDDKTSTEVAKSKSKLVAYLLWFFLGWAGIHHFYLRRYRQGVLWLTSFGGLFGIGYLGDIFRLQKYVHYSNKRYLFVERLRQNKKYSKSGPRVSDNFHRIVSQVMFGIFYRGLIYCAIPWDSHVMDYAAIYHSSGDSLWNIHGQQCRSAAKFLLVVLAWSIHWRAFRSIHWCVF